MSKRKESTVDWAETGNGSHPVNRLSGKVEKSPLEKKTSVAITPPNLQMASFRVIGTTPYVQQKFSAKAKEQMRQKMMAGGTAKKNTKREPRDFNQNYEDAQYRDQTGGWNGVPATQFRAAMIAACRLCNFKMTNAKQCITVEGDGYDPDEMKPLIKFSKGKPKRFDQSVPNDNGGADIRVRPMWEPGWECNVRITFDADYFTLQDVTNLLMRAGLQVGIGEGRQASRLCAGLGWGAFRIVMLGEK